MSNFTSFKEYLIEKATDESVVSIKILQRYKFDDDSVFCIFEGYEDQSFYVNFLRNACTARVENYISHGKAKSYLIYSSIDWNKFDRRRILFFIDKDFSDLLAETWPVDTNIFVTTNYSIENYIPSRGLLERVIREIYHFNEVEELNKILDKYEEQFAFFYNQVIPIIAWMLLMKSRNLRPNFTNLKIDQLFVITSELSCVKTKVKRIEYLEKVTGVKTPADSFVELRNWIIILAQKTEHKTFVRGKFELYLFVDYCLLVERYLITKGHKPKTSVNLNDTNCVEILGPRITAVDDLFKFFSSLFSTN